VQIKIRVAGVLAVSAAAIAIMGGPAFASNNPITGNIVGNGNIPILSGNNVQIPVQIPVDICGNAVGSWASPTPAAWAAPRPCWTTAATSTAVFPGAGPHEGPAPLS
jgi:ChpA-C